MDKMLSFHINHLFLSENQQPSHFTIEMDPNEKQLQSAGICHRLLCYLMKTLAAQAVKPVTLGSSLVPAKPTQKPISSATRQLPQLPPFHAVTDSHPRGSTERDEDSESLASIDIEDVTCSCRNQEVTVEMKGEYGAKAPKKTVSIKDEPEIIFLGNRRRKTVAEKQMPNVGREKERELRPLRSILKVGSNLGATMN